MDEDRAPDPAPERLVDAMRAVRPTRPEGVERSHGLARLLGAITDSAPTPTKVDRFVIEEKLGEGGMGVVFRAHDPTLDRRVAIKVLRAIRGAVEQERILTEARALARLSHPGVVGVYDVGVADEQLYVAMEYVAGMSLRAWLDAHADVPVLELVEMFLQAGRGLAAAHAAGVVHRDFKPDNVLVGDDGRTRVVDFGLARVDADNEDGRATSLPGPDGEHGGSGLAGTRMFMAPEVVAGARADARADQYAYCISLWQALDPEAEPGARTTRIPSSIEPVLRRGLARDPDARWPDMNALLEQLEHAVAARPADRLRNVLLDRVERLWINGVLETSVDETGVIDLPLASVGELVDADQIELSPEGDASPTTRDLPRAFAASGRALLVVGAPGSGKTTAILGLTEQLLRDARRDPDAPAPVVLNLAAFARHRKGLLDWAENELVTKYSLARLRARSWLESDRLVLVLDGLDEVARERRARCVERINAFLLEHPVPVVVSCREAVYRRIGVHLRLGGAVRVEPPNASEARALLDRLGERGSEAVRVLEADEALRREATTPLMLRMLAVAGSGNVHVEGLWAELYARYLDYALEPRGGVRTWEKQRMLRGLRWLAGAMQRRDVTEVWLERMQASWLGRPAQRWFAIGIGLLVVLVSMIGINVAAGVSVGRPAASGVVLGVGSLPVVLIFARGLRIRPVEKLRWSWRRTLRGLPITWALALPLLTVYGVFRGSPVWINVMGGLFGGALAAVAFGLQGSEEESRVRPNEGIRQSLRNAVVVGGLGFVITAAAFGGLFLPIARWLPSVLPVEPMVLGTFGTMVAAATFLGTMLFMIYGGVAVVYHAALRLSLRLFSPLPLDLISFLDHAADRAILRRVGGGYIFLHRTLLDHLASEGEAA